MKKGQINQSINYKFTYKKNFHCTLYSLEKKNNLNYFFCSFEAETKKVYLVLRRKGKRQRLKTTVSPKKQETWAL